MPATSQNNAAKIIADKLL